MNKSRCNAKWNERSDRSPHSLNDDDSWKMLTAGGLEWGEY
jgi:hypothetical protein